ncbi:GTPB3 GTPase, partial [Leucopsar rothschildi]|nr:GTPB3 GTPase [Leucopsar rothschildi]
RGDTGGGAGGTGDTIFALSSAPGRCGVAVIRASGPGSRGALQSLAGTPKMPPPRVLALRRIRDPHTAETLDRGLVVWFPGLGGINWGRLPGLRPAEPGEFTLRAFRRGKLDLTAAEGLRDLIGAETEAQRRQALRQMEGELGQLYQGWSHTLTQGLSVCFIPKFGYGQGLSVCFIPQIRVWTGALCVCFIPKFGCGQGLSVCVLSPNSVASTVRALEQQIRAHLRDGRRGELLRGGVRAVIAGPPNAGKSSLLNLLWRVPKCHLCPGTPCHPPVLQDGRGAGGAAGAAGQTAGTAVSAGGGDGGDPKGSSWLCQADLVLAVLDVTSVSPTPRALGAALATLEPPPGTPCVLVLNKADLLGGQGVSPSATCAQGHPATLLSCKTGEGLEALLELLAKQLEQLCGDPLLGSSSLTQSRHSRHLGACVAALARFNRGDNGDLAVAAEQLRVARRELGRITGHVGTEDILDVIFRDFCVGK